MANRYWLPMWCAISVVILGSFIHSGQTLECYWCMGESCNKVSKDTQTVNCTELNSNPSNSGNVTDETNSTTNGTSPNTNGTNTNTNGSNTNTNGTNTNGNGTQTNGTNTTGNSTQTNGTNSSGNKTFGINLEYDGDGYNDDNEMDNREKRDTSPLFYAEPMYRCLKVVTADKKNTMRRCAIANSANNVSDTCNTYTGFNSSQASCYLCDEDKCNTAHVSRAPAALAIIIISLSLHFNLAWE